MGNKSSIRRGLQSIHLSSERKELRVKLKSIHEQVVVIVGANSGIGRETAVQFAKRGAKVVVARRSLPALEELVHEIQS